jgi:hypothetical protein
MKYLCCLIVLLMGGVSLADTGEVEVGNPEVLSKDFVVHGPKALKVEDVDERPALVFRHDRAVTTLAVYAPGGTAQTPPVGQVTGRFKLSKGTSFGIAVRATQDLDDAYTTVVNTGDAGRGLMRIFRGGILPNRDFGQPRAHKGVGLAADTWYRLRVLARDHTEGGRTTVHLSLVVLEDQADHVVGELSFIDDANPLLKDGSVALRFYRGPTDEAVVAVRSLTIQPQPGS